jgi:hypothetical protein
VAIFIPSNEVCYDRVVVADERGTGRFFKTLQEHAARNGLLESTFPTQLKPQFFDVFWELYLAAALDAAHSAVKRGRAKALEPDFYFSSADSTVFVEAVACGDPRPGNGVSPPDDDDDDFESGILSEGRVFQWLAQVLDSKIMAVDRPEAKASMAMHGEYAIVIALNGCRALNGHAHGDIAAPWVPLIARLVFGAIDQLVNRDGQLVSVLSVRARKDPNEPAEFPVAHFANPVWRVVDPKTGAVRSASIARIAGILYSQATPWHTAVPLGGDFIFIQNPFGPDLTELFRFCPGKVWVHQGGAIRPFDFAEDRPPSAISGCLAR